MNISVQSNVPLFENIAYNSFALENVELVSSLVDIVGTEHDSAMSI